MKSKEELMAMCEGYRQGLVNDRAFYGNDLSGLDDWVKWDDYELNIFGSHYSVRLDGDVHALSVEVYPRDWHDELPEALYSFDIKGESK